MSDITTINDNINTKNEELLILSSKLNTLDNDYRQYTNSLSKIKVKKSKEITEMDSTYTNLNSQIRHYISNSLNKIHYNSEITELNKEIVDNRLSHSNIDKELQKLSNEYAMLLCEKKNISYN